MINLGRINLQPNRLLLKTQNTILSAAFVLAAASGASAILGLVKNRLLIHYFGVSHELSVFYTADRIPSLIYSVLVVGAVSTVFIPIFTGVRQKDPDLAWKTSILMIKVALGFFAVFGILLFILAPQILWLLSVGRFSPQEIALGAGLMRLMLFAQLILVLSSFATSISQAFKYFLIPALAPLVYSLGIILGIIFLAPHPAIGIFGPAYGILIGALFHLLIQIPVLKKVGFTLPKRELSLSLKDSLIKYNPLNTLRNKEIQEMIRLVPPRIVSVLIANLIYTVNNSLAILISTPSVVYLKFASQLQYFPVGLFGVSMAAAALPTLSEEANDKKLFTKTYLTALCQTLYLVVPISIMLLVLRVPVVRLVYGAPSFPWEATIKTATTLGLFSISIWAQSSVYLTTRAFYALKDTMSPVKVSIVTIVINIGLSLIFIKGLGWGVWALALSFSITSFLDFVVMFTLLARKLEGLTLGALAKPALKIGLAGALMGICLYIPMKFLDIVVLDTTRTVNLIVLTGVAGSIGFSVYLFFTWLLKVPEIELFYKVLRRLHINKELLYRVVPAGSHTSSDITRH